MKSHFFAYISKLRWIQRWGLKRNTIQENVMEHSWEVSIIAHALALLRNKYYGGQVDVNAVVVAALYHDCSEVITGDMPSPIKYFTQEVTAAYKAIEREAEKRLVELLPEELREDYRPVVMQEALPQDYHDIIKAADTIAAYLKCKMEVSAGNREFSKAEQEIEKRLSNIALPEVEHFLRVFASSYSLTLDELLEP